MCLESIVQETLTEMFSPLKAHSFDHADLVDLVLGIAPLILAQSKSVLRITTIHTSSPEE